MADIAAVSPIPRPSGFPELGSGAVPNAGPESIDIYGRGEHMTERTDLGMGPKESSGVRTAAVLMIQLLCAGVSLITPAMAILQEY